MQNKNVRLMTVIVLNYTRIRTRQYVPCTLTFSMLIAVKQWSDPLWGERLGENVSPSYSLVLPLV